MKTLFTEDQRLALLEAAGQERHSVQLFVNAEKGHVKKAKTILTGAVKQALGVKRLTVQPYGGRWDREHDMPRLTISLTTAESEKVTLVYTQRFKLAGYHYPPIEAY